MASYDEVAIMSEISGADCHIAPLSRVTSREVEPAVKTTCSHLIPLEHKFLVLAPVISSSYPAQKTEASTPTEPFDVDIVKKERRSSSSGSSASDASGKLRFLKLGPVHFGGEPGELDYVLLQPEE